MRVGSGPIGNGKVDRRTVLQALGGAAVVALAGCSDGGTERELEPASVPAAEFEVEFDADANEAVISLTAGDDLTASSLYIRHDSREVAWHELENTPDESETTVTVGDSATVPDVVSGEELAIVFEDGDRPQELDRFEVP